MLSHGMPEGTKNELGYSSSSEGNLLSSELNVEAQAPGHQPDRLLELVRTRDPLMPQSQRRSSGSCFGYLIHTQIHRPRAFKLPSVKRL